MCVSVLRQGITGEFYWSPNSLRRCAAIKELKSAPQHILARVRLIARPLMAAPMGIETVRRDN